MEQFLCYSCFRQLPSANVKFCPNCGGAVAQDWDRHPHALPYGTVLGGRYITGKVLGQGGFGITYLAQDHKTSRVVAVKEFFPDTMASRGDANSIVPFTGQRGEDFVYGRTMFLEEARTLAELRDIPGVVQVYSYFEEFGTAYFAMEYVDHINFQRYIDEHGGRISVEDAKRVLLPVMDTMAAVHAKGIIHRDLKPDNLYISSAGAVKVLDFGSARYSMGEKSRSLDVILTHGFAPREQYSRHGRQGAYTDVYALAATFYYAITGRKPPDSIDRLEEDTLALPSSLGAQISREEEDVLLKALAVEPQDRFATMTAFKNAMIHAGNAAAQTPPAPAAVPDLRGPASRIDFQEPTAPPARKPSPPPPVQPQPIPDLRNAQAGFREPTAPPVSAQPAAQPQKKKVWLIPAGIAAAAVIALVLILVLPGKQKPAAETAAPVGAAPSAAPIATLAPAPNVIDPSSSGNGGSSVPALSGSLTSDSGIAGYYPLTSITSGGVTMDASGQAAKENGLDKIYIVMEDGTHGTLYSADDAETLVFNGSTVEIDGVSCGYTIKNGVITINTRLNEGTDEQMDMELVFTRSNEKPPAADSGSGGESGNQPAAVTASGVCGDSAAWELSGDTLHITGTGRMYDYTYTSEIPWYEMNEQIDFVVIDRGITRIGEGAFHACEMVSVEIPDTVEAIGAYAFLGCPYLFDVTIPASVRGIGSNAFALCDALEWARIESNFVNIYDECFDGCTAMTAVTFTGAVGDVAANAFANCKATVTYPSGDASWLRYVGKNLGGELGWVMEGFGPVNVSRVYADRYSLALPDDWLADMTWEVNGDFASFYHKASAASGNGGYLFSIGLYQRYEDYAGLPHAELLGSLSNGSEYLAVVAVYPTDVQFSAAQQEQYLSIFNNLWNAFQYLSGENGWTITFTN